jgi:hypothetical protein
LPVAVFLLIFHGIFHTYSVLRAIVGCAGLYEDEVMVLALGIFVYWKIQLYAKIVLGTIGKI